MEQSSRLDETDIPSGCSFCQGDGKMNELTISLDPHRKTPLYEQIYGFIREEIRGGRIRAGERLPSARALSGYLSVSRSTVDLAYEQLVSEGYLESVPCKGYFVCEIEGLYRLDEKKEETKEEAMHPFLWRFWTKTPQRGRMAVYDGSWYIKVLSDRFEKKMRESEIENCYRSICSFEKQITEDGTLLIKLFLDIDQKEQKKRFDEVDNKYKEVLQKCNEMEKAIKQNARVMDTMKPFLCGVKNCPNRKSITFDTNNN